MNIDLASAMRRALEHIRAQDLNEATAVIQAALAGHCSSREGPSSAGVSSPAASHGPFSVLDRGVDTVEPAPLPCRSQSARGNAIPLASNPLSRARHRPPRLIDLKAISASAKNDSDRKAADHAVGPNAAPCYRRIRRSLGDVVNALQDGRSSSLAPAAPVSLQVPNGAQFLARSYACRAGSRQYKLYIPAERPDGPRGSLSCCMAARRARTISQSAQA
jgi:hypothetical protein